MLGVSHLACLLGLLGGGVDGCGEKSRGLAQVQGMIPGFEAGPLSFKLLPRSSPAAKSNSMVVRSGSGGPGPCREDTESVDLPAQGILGAPPNLCSESLALSQSPSPAPPNSSSVGNGEGGQSAMLYPTPTQ